MAMRQIVDTQFVKLVRFQYLTVIIVLNLLHYKNMKDIQCKYRWQYDNKNIARLFKAVLT